MALVGAWQELVNAPRSISLPGFGYLLAVVAAVPLVSRRRHPGAVGLGCLGLFLLYHLASYPGGAPAIAGFVAVYSVAAEGLERPLLGLSRGGRGRSLVAAVVLALANGVVTALPPHALAVTNAAVYGPAFGLVIVAFVGDALGARTAELQDRVQQRTEEGLRRLAEERLRIARDLHDIVAHTVAVITVQAAVAADALDDRPEEARAALAVIRQAAREATRELSATVGVLRTAEPNAEGEPPAVMAPVPGLADLGELIRGLPGLDVVVSRSVAEGAEADLPRPVDNAAYRIVQEALTNVVKHAGTDQASVAIVYQPDAVELQIADQGDGAAPPVGDRESPGPGGFGVIGMRERAAAVGGTVTAGPGVSRGFVVSARLPRQAP